MCARAAAGAVQPPARHDVYPLQPDAPAAGRVRGARGRVGRKPTLAVRGPLG